ncbi:hypothetical protein GRJ2_001429800 [Grus japonensis]|uniref:Uncharacterized protein n=1 Tax=Grus japonensis TaxID=30415 RepID=A0ABC9WX45_GRUJA
MEAVAALGLRRWRRRQRDLHCCISSNLVVKSSLLAHTCGGLLGAGVEEVADLISILGWSKPDSFEFASIVVKNSLLKEMRRSDWHRSATSEILLSR